VMNLLLPWWICSCRDEFAFAVAHVGHRMIPLKRDSMKCELFWAIEIRFSSPKQNLDNFKYFV
jgi:hypothetical protein